MNININKSGVLGVNEISEDSLLYQNSRFGRTIRPNILSGILDVETTKDGTQRKISYLGSISSTELISYVGRVLCLSYEVSTYGERYSAEMGYTAWNKTRYGLHGSLTCKKSDGSSELFYPFASYLNYNGPQSRLYVSWTVPTGYKEYGDLSISVQDFDKPSSTNNAVWFIRNVKLEIGNYPTPYVESGWYSSNKNGYLTSVRLYEI